MSEQPKTQLWLLRPRKDLPHDNDPFDQFDTCCGMVVEAATEERARKIANTIPLHQYVNWEFEKSTAPDAFLRGIEDKGPDNCEDVDCHRHELTDQEWEGKNVWLDPKYTTCVPLVCTGQERRVIWDVTRG